MSFDDKMKHTGEDLGGKAKEAYGKATGDKEKESEGKMDQLSADIKDKASDFGDKAKDVASDLGSNLKAAAEKLKEGFSSDSK